MKIRSPFLIIFFIAYFQISFSQNNVLSIVNTNYIGGTWFLELELNDELTFKRKGTNLKDYKGLSIKIDNYGDFNYAKSSYGSKKCGNHFNSKSLKGKWVLDEKKLIFKTTVSILNYGKEFEILQLDINKLILLKSTVIE